MQIVGPEPLEANRDERVHTIDIWFSPTRRRWMVERLDAAGDPIGVIHQCRHRLDALACAADWLRRHPETHLATARDRIRRTAR